MDSSLRLRFILLGGLFLAIVSVGLLVSSFYWQTSRLTTVVLPPNILACEEDADCRLSNRIGCCPCDAGGGQGAVNTRMRPRLNAFLRGACSKGVPCLNVFSCRDDLRPACKARRCVLIPRAAEAKGEHIDESAATKAG